MGKFYKLNDGNFNLHKKFICELFKYVLFKLQMSLVITSHAE